MFLIFLLVYIFRQIGKYIHIPVQVPRRDAPRWLPRLLILLKVPPRSQIMPARPINEKVFYAGHKESSPPVTFAKIGNPH